MKEGRERGREGGGGEKGREIGRKGGKREEGRGKE